MGEGEGECMGEGLKGRVEHRGEKEGNLSHVSFRRLINFKNK